MAVYQVQHCFQGRSGDSTDRYCNTFHMLPFGSHATAEAGTGIDWTLPFGGSGASMGDRVAGYFVGFYNQFGPLVLGSQVQSPGRTVKIYRLSDTSPRAPRYSFTDPDTDPVGNDSGDNINEGVYMPEEVAVCLSYEAIAAVGTNRARRRGRIYIGPLNTLIVGQDSIGARVPVEAQEAITESWVALTTFLDALDISIGIFSPTDDVFLPWATAWVDNAFDTQRRRGIAPNARTVVTPA